MLKTKKGAPLFQQAAALSFHRFFYGIWIPLAVFYRGYRLLVTRMRPSCTLFRKKSFTEQPARPEDAQAQAQAQEDAQAQEEAQAQEDAQDERCEEPPERVDREEEEDERDRLTGTLTTFTWIYVFGESP